MVLDLLTTYAITLLPLVFVYIVLKIMDKM